MEKTLILKKSGGKKGVYIGDQGLACYSLQTFITFHMMQTTVSPTLAGIAHHLVMRELKRHKGTGTEKKYVLCAIPLFPYKIKTKT